MLNLLCLLLALIPSLEHGRITPVTQDIKTAHIVPTHEGWITLEELPDENRTLYSDAIFSRVKEGDLSALEEGQVGPARQC